MRVRPSLKMERWPRGSHMIMMMIVRMLICKKGSAFLSDGHGVQSPCSVITQEITKEVISFPFQYLRIDVVSPRSFATSDSSLDFLVREMIFLAFDLKGFILMENLKGKLKDLSGTPGTAESSSTLDACNLSNCDLDKTFANMGVEELSSYFCNDKRKRVMDIFQSTTARTQTVWSSGQGNVRKSLRFRVQISAKSRTLGDFFSCVSLAGTVIPVAGGRLSEDMYPNRKQRANSGSSSSRSM
ncbi:hypothetical protein FXO37_31961 [Capsicum annuum]|nr:hypothetical protein FXO37_31961 [Capsicum annuum]